MTSKINGWFSGLVASAFVAAGLAASTAALAGPVYNFENITNNGLQDVAAQLSVEVNDAGGGQVAFIFRNTGAIASSITDVYFDDGTLLGIASIINGTGVSFSQGASPPDLPGGNNVDPDFQTTAGFLADSNTPIAANGVNPGEQLTILFNLINGMTYLDTLAALDGGVDLRIGLHVQAIGTAGNSDSFINIPPGGTPSVPEPGTLALIGAGLAGLALIRRRRRV